MRAPLPYHPDLGALLRRLASPDQRAVWLRLEGGVREVFAAFPVGGIILCNQVVEQETASDFSYARTWPEFWAALPSLLERLPASGDNDGAFPGGLAGFIGYDAEPLAMAPGFPAAWLGLYPRFVHIDHSRQTAAMVCLNGHESIGSGWTGLLEFARKRVLACPPPAALPLPEATAFQLTRAFEPLTSRARYRENFSRIQAYLNSGDCYQVNYAQAFRAGCRGSGVLAMERLLQTSQASHAAWLGLPEGEVMSLSPELFLRVQDGHIITRPIKGTAPRGLTPCQDAALREGLADSPKNRAENLMIVDLLRHDIGRHATTGSVRVERLFAVESLPQVHHLVSTVSGRLRAESHVVDLVRDSFPGGSITGAPKKRAMEIIAELEDTPRSVYCGSIGYIGVDGSAELNIAIRTLLRVGDDILAWAGGGIVADSRCEDEYQECFHKIGALMRALEDM